MSCNFLEEIRVYAGPNRYVQYPAAVAIVDNKDSIIDGLKADKVMRLLTQEDFRPAPPEGREISSFDFMCALTQAFLDAIPENVLKLESGSIAESGRRFIAVPYHEPNAAIISLKAALGICNDVFRICALPEREFDSRFAQTIKSLSHALAVLQSFHPQYDISVLINAAKECGVPVRLIDVRTRTWQFGDGVNGNLFFNGVSSDYDCSGGARLSSDKFCSSILISSLGYPTVKSALVSDIKAARSAANSIGYPVVVKPIHLSQGGGVTANVRNPTELEAAFGRAVSASSSVIENYMQMRNEIIIEEHVPGDDFRILICDGELMWAIRRRHARVVGDGRSTIEQLISAENRRRREEVNPRFGLHHIEVDEDVVCELKKAGLTVSSVLPKNVVAVLRSAANTALGGTVEDVTDAIDESIIEMAKAIARTFRLSTMGLDLIIKDIERPWHKQKCAVIEINAGPAVTGGAFAKRIIERRFASKNYGRIPVVVTVGADREAEQAISQYLQNAFGMAGCVSSRAFEFGSFQRSSHVDAIAARISALVADPACAALLVSIESNFLDANGFPVDLCELTLLDGRIKLSSSARGIVSGGSKKVSVYDQQSLSDILRRSLSAS